MTRINRIGAALLGAMAVAAGAAGAAVNGHLAPDNTVALPGNPQPRYATLCEACGGANGVPFDRVHVHRASAQIVLLAPPGSNLRMLNGDDKLSSALERAGFAVLVVESQQALDAAMSDTPADVVLADVADAMPLRERLRGSSAGPLVLSVVPGADPLAALAVKQCRVRAPVRSSRQFVKQVESFVSARQSGSALACETPG